MAKGPIVSSVDFIKAYIHAETLDEVAKTLGWKKTTVQAKVSKLKKAGVDLPKKLKVKEVIDAKALNALVKEELKKKEKEQR